MSIAGAAITAGASLLGTGANMVTTGKLNKKNREWQEKMWNATNEYNSPVQQMARFKEAGLNPHLIYGQGNSGNASIASAPDQKVPDYNFADAAMAYVATRKQQTEVDNLQKAKEVMEADIIKKGAETANILSNTATTDQQRAQSASLFDLTYETAQANLNNIGLQGKKLQVDIQKVLADTKLSQAQKANVEQTIQESRSRILNMKADRDIKGQELELKKLELNLREKGINPNDPAWMRILNQVYEGTGIKESVTNPDSRWRKGVDYLIERTVAPFKWLKNK